MTFILLDPLPLPTRRRQTDFFDLVTELERLEVSGVYSDKDSGEVYNCNKSDFYLSVFTQIKTVYQFR